MTLDLQEICFTIRAQLQLDFQEKAKVEFGGNKLFPSPCSRFALFLFLTSIPSSVPFPMSFLFLSSALWVSCLFLSSSLCERFWLDFALLPCVSRFQLLFSTCPTNTVVTHWCFLCLTCGSANELRRMSRTRRSVTLLSYISLQFFNFFLYLPTWFLSNREKPPPSYFCFGLFFASLSASLFHFHLLFFLL